MKPGFLLRGSPVEKLQGFQALRDSRQARSNSSQQREDSLNSKIQLPNKRLDPKFLCKNNRNQGNLEAPHPESQPQNGVQSALNINSQSIPHGQINRIDVSLQKTPQKTRIYQDTWDSRSTLACSRTQEPRITQANIYRTDQSNLLIHGGITLDNGHYQQRIQQFQHLPQNQAFSSQVPCQGFEQPITKAEDKAVLPNFLALLKLFQPQNELSYHKLKQSVQFFLNIQIQKVLGHCSQPMHVTKFSLKTSQEINKQLVHKHQQIQLIHKIINLYRAFVEKQFQKNPYNREELSRLSQKVWNYLYEQYNQRFKDYTAHCYEMLNRDRKHSNRTKTEHLHNDTILQRIEELNKLSRSEKRLPDNQSTSNLQGYLDDQTEKKRYHPFDQTNEFDFYKQTGNGSIWLKRDSYHPRKEVTFIIKGKEVGKDNAKDQNLRQLTFRQRVVSRYPVKFIAEKQEKTTYEKLSLQIEYNFSIQWLDGADNSQIFLQERDQTLHCLDLSGDPTFEDIEAQLILSAKVKHCQQLRSDCQIKVSQLKKSQKVRHYRAHLIVRQRLVSLPDNYFWKVSQWKQDCVARVLEIGNEFGVVKWSQEIDLKKIDFAKESISIEDKCVRCQSLQLNKPCLVTFYGLPRELKYKSSKNAQQLFSRYIKKMGDVSLVGIDRQKNLFTVKFTSFWDALPSKMYPSVPSTALKSHAEGLD